MKRLTRFDAMFKILNFGRKEEHQLIAEREDAKAYQIEYARNVLIYFLNENAVRDVCGKINKMVEYTIRENGVWEYDAPNFVHDEFTRDLLNKLKGEFER